MFIKRQRRRLTKPYQDEAGVLRNDWCALDFAVVESLQTERGPRQRVLCYVGTIEERRAHYSQVRERFYEAAIPRIQAIKTTRRNIRKLIKSLEAMVPRP